MFQQCKVHFQFPPQVTLQEHTFDCQGAPASQPNYGIEQGRGRQGPGVREGAPHRWGKCRKLGKVGGRGERVRWSDAPSQTSALAQSESRAKSDSLFHRRRADHGRGRLSQCKAHQQPTPFSWDQTCPLLQIGRYWSQKLTILLIHSLLLSKG